MDFKKHTQLRINEINFSNSIGFFGLFRTRLRTVQKSKHVAECTHTDHLLIPIYVRATSSGANNVLRSQSDYWLPRLTVWSTSWASFASKIIMKRRQTTMLWVSGRGLGFQASDSTLTQLTLQSTAPKNRKQLLGLPRSTWSEQKTV